MRRKLTRKDWNPQKGLKTIPSNRISPSFFFYRSQKNKAYKEGTRPYENVKMHDQREKKGGKKEGKKSESDGKN